MIVVLAQESSLLEIVFWCLVRNHRPGPDWIPGTIIEVLGPVTYIVEIEEGGQHWKRHINQLKDWLAPTVSDNSRSQI